MEELSFGKYFEINNKKVFITLQSKNNEDNYSIDDILVTIYNSDDNITYTYYTKKLSENENKYIEALKEAIEGYRNKKEEISIEKFEQFKIEF